MHLSNTAIRNAKPSDKAKKIFDRAGFIWKLPPAGAVVAVFEEFQTEIDWWAEEADGFASRQQTEQAWQVSLDDIKARNYNLDIKNPHVAKQINHDPNELLQQYQAQQQTITELRDQFKASLQQALNS